MVFDLFILDYYKLLLVITTLGYIGNYIIF